MPWPIMFPRNCHRAASLPAAAIFLSETLPEKGFGRTARNIKGSGNQCRYNLAMLSNQAILTMLREICLKLEADQSLEALARKSGWSKFHFQRGFTKTVGETPKQYALRLRLEFAAVLLVTCTHSVNAIAESVGFRSHEVFVRAFRRRFSCTPTQYRREVGERKEVMFDGPLIKQVGPCVGLYHLPLKHKGVQVMSSLEIQRKELKSQPILYIRRRVVHTELQPVFAECFPKLYGHCMKSGISMAGQPISRYVSTGAGLWTVDCAIPVVAPPSEEGEMKAGELQAGPVAFAVHKGPYDVLPETYGAIEQWIEENGLQQGGPAWEVYVTDPAEHPDPANWKTEVYWPIAP